MGNLRKKPNVELSAAPVSVSPVKAAKSGKRSSEEAMENQASSKKHKIEVEKLFQKENNAKKLKKLFQKENNAKKLKKLFQKENNAKKLKKAPIDAPMEMKDETSSSGSSSDSEDEVSAAPVSVPPVKTAKSGKRRRRRGRFFAASPKTAQEKKKRKVIISDDKTESEDEEEEEEEDEGSSSSSSEEGTTQESQGEVPSRRETEGERSASVGFWSDEKEKTFTFRSDMNEAIVPQGEAPDMPVHLLTALMIAQDKAYLDSLTDLRLAALQSQLSIGSVLVAKYISDGSRNRLQGLKEGMEVVEGLKANKAELEEKMDKKEVDFTNQKNSLLIENRQLADEALSWEKKYNSAIEEREAEEEKRLEEGKTWEKKVVAQEEKAQKYLQEHHAKIDTLEKEVEKLRTTAPVSSASITVEEASAIYKQTNDFKIEMGGFIDTGFQMLKAALVKDGKMKEKDLNAYDYLRVMARVMKGEL